MRVDQVVLESLLAPELLHARHEVAQVGVHVLARHRGLGPCSEMDDARPVPHLHDARDGGVLRAGEHVDVRAHAAQLAGRLADVDVHPARLLAAGRGEGARVHGQDRDPQLHGRIRILRSGSGVGPKSRLYDSSPRRKSKTGTPRSMASRIMWASSTMPGARRACAGSKPEL